MVTRRNKRSARKTKKGARAATVEGIQASFQSIDTKVKTLIAKGGTDSALATCIRNAWDEQFHMDLSPAAIKGMIVHYRAVHKGRGTRRKQKGGMAPLDWTMGQGTTAHVYGRFPVEIGTTPQVVRALDLGRFYENRVGRALDTTGGHPAPGQKGAGLFDALAMGHAPASVPRNFMEMGVSAIQGAPITNPAPSPVSAHVPLATAAPASYDATSISSISSLAPIYKP
jgi:hypothetical protein